MHAFGDRWSEQTTVDKRTFLLFVAEASAERGSMTNHDDHFSIVFGALADPILEQLQAQGRTIQSVDAVQSIQRDADAITRCLVQGFIPASVGERARRKLIRKIGKCSVPA